MARHVHADLMIAYAEDASLKIECSLKDRREWVVAEYPSFDPALEYRIKPKNMVKYYVVSDNGCITYFGQILPSRPFAWASVVKHTFDPDRKKLLSVEIVK